VGEERIRDISVPSCTFCREKNNIFKSTVNNKLFNTSSVLFEKQAIFVSFTVLIVVSSKSFAENAHGLTPLKTHAFLAI
jgi:hypothetical protein